VATSGNVTTFSGVDELCEALFLSPRARERDDNLLFVREQLLRSDMDLAALLDLYARVRRGKPMRDDETSPLVSRLRLSGVVRGTNGRLQVRNRIYERVFDLEWVREHMPDAELRRQRAAYRQGLLRAVLVSSVVLAIMGGLALTAGRQARRAEEQRRLAQHGQRTLRHILYASQIDLAQQAIGKGELGRAEVLLESWVPGPGQEELRSFDWRHLWRLCQQRDALYSIGGQTPEEASVAFSPDGKLLALVGEDNSIRLWEVRTRRTIAALKGHTRLVRAITFSPDGRTLASSGDQTVRLWDVATRRQVALLHGYRDPSRRLRFSPDGSTLAIADQENLRLWDAHRKRDMALFTRHRGGVASMSFSPDGKTLAVGSLGDRVRLYDLTARRLKSTVAGQALIFPALAYSADGRFLALGSGEGPVKLWEVATKREAGSLAGHRDAITELAFSPDGTILATASRDHTVKLWDLRAKREATTFQGHEGAVYSVAFSPDGRLLASGSGDRTVKLWDPVAKGDETTFLRQSTGFSAVAYSPDGKTLATGAGDGVVKLWDAVSGRELAALTGHRDAVWRVVFSPDGKMLASTSGLPMAGGPMTVVEAKLWDLPARRAIVTTRAVTPSPEAVAFSPDGALLAVGSSAATVKLWSVAARREVAALDGHDYGVWAVAFSPDGKTLVVNDARALRVWDVPTRRVTAVLRGSITWVPLLFSPDGSTLITGGTSGLKLWDWGARRVAATLKRQDFRGFRTVVSPDGRTLAMTTGDAVVLWNLAVRRQVAVLQGHRGTVHNVAFSPDGNTLASASEDGTIRVWRATPFQATDALRLLWSSGADRSVEFQWRWLPHALAYNVYRRPGNARQPFAKITPRPITATSFADRNPDLVNGRPHTYAVAPVYPDSPEAPKRGEREAAQIVFQATPVAAPRDFRGCNLNEGTLPGTLTFDPATDEFTIRGSGADLWGAADGGYFVNRPVTGDFKATVVLLGRPKLPPGSGDPGSEQAKAGLMVRESLEPGARHVSLLAHATGYLQSQWRLSANEDTSEEEALPDAKLKTPIVLRLTRRGNVVRAHYSQDNGQSFQPAGEPVQFDEALARRVYVGLAVSAADINGFTEAKFRRLQIDSHGR
jgi:WD40 repeat protein